MSDENVLPIDPDPAPAAGEVDSVMVVSIAVGGTVGSAGRYAIADGWPVEPGSFPWATLVANVTGSLLLGLALVVFAVAWPASSRWHGCVSTGVLGALTTMSTFLVEAVVLGKDGDVAVAFFYVAVTLSAGLVAAAAGIGIGRSVGVPARKSTP